MFRHRFFVPPLTDDRDMTSIVLDSMIPIGWYPPELDWLLSHASNDREIRICCQVRSHAVPCSWCDDLVGLRAAS